MTRPAQARCPVGPEAPCPSGARTPQEKGDLLVRRFKEEASTPHKTVPVRLALAVRPGICWHLVAQALPGDETMAWQTQ